MMPQIECRCSQTVYPPSPAINHPINIWRLFWMGVICSTLVIGWFPRIGRTEGVGRIRGVIQREGKGFAEQRIMLIRFGPNQDVQRFPGQTDAEGRFFFENLETGAAFTYFVGIRYKEQLRRSEPVILQSEEPAEVVLEVSEQPAQEAKESDAPPQLRIINHLMVIVGRSTHLEVGEIVKIVNTGATPYMDRAGHGGAAGISLHLPLPRGHYGIGQVQGLAAEHVRDEPSGLSYVAPLAPGEHQVVYTYNLPWHDDLATILVERTLGTSRLDVLVEDERLNTTSDLQFGGRSPIDPGVFAHFFGGRFSIDPQVFAHFHGMNLEAHSRSWLQLTPRQTSASLLHMGAYGLIMGIVLLGMFIPLRDVWYSQAQQDHRETDILQHAQKADVKGVGRHLLQDMARLDDEYHQGMVDGDTYQQRRQAYKEQLCKIIEELQRSEASQKAIEARGRVV